MGKDRSLPESGDGWTKHLVVFAILTMLCILMYRGVMSAGFEFDDIPNITRNPAMAMRELTLGGLKRAIWQDVAPNRIVVSLSFALQYWASQYLPGNENGEPAFIAWQFRLVNCWIHLLAGFLVYLLLRRLLRLPRIEADLSRNAWALAFLTTLVWYCSPVQTQAVTYIVQRATSLAALFMAGAMLSYCLARQAGREERGRRWGWMCVSVVCALAAVFSKEYAVLLLPLVLLVEVLLIEPGGIGYLWRRMRGNSVALKTEKTDASKRSLRWMGLAIVLFGAVNLLAVYWALGRQHWTARAGESDIQEMSRSQRAMTFISRHVIDDTLSGRQRDDRLRVTPWQRLLTQFRVVAMYQSLLLAPLPSRMSLDYDFPESTALNNRGHWWSLLLVFGVGAGVWFVPERYRFQLIVGIILFMVLLDLIGAYGFSQLWRDRWPLPAMIWHAGVVAFAVSQLPRRPLLSFAILFFYIALSVESTILMLEMVFEHRLYLPSVGFYLAVVIVLHECLYPAREEGVGAGSKSVPAVGGQGNV